MVLRFLTAGESHGKNLTAIIEGIPSGLEVTEEDINKHLSRRQKGYGRGGRMQIETDKVQINSGIRHGKTIGSPVSFTIENKDWQNWQEVMSSSPIDLTDERINEKMQQKQIDHVRPGHADLSGTLKYDHSDIRNVLERSSARETAARVAIGALCLKFLQEFDIDIFSHVLTISSVEVDLNKIPDDFKRAKSLAEESPVRCINKETEKLLIAEIDRAKEEGDTIGGIIQIIAHGLPVGLGSYVHWDRRLDANIAKAIMSIPAIKSVEIGLGSLVSNHPGSKAHDEIFPKDHSLEYQRQTNYAGGIEGGMTNGMPIIIRAAMKPIPTLKQPLRSVNINTGKEHLAHYERSDVCAVPAAGVVCEAMLAFSIAEAFIDKFGGDSIKEVKANYKNYRNNYQQR